jgi:hypothetical protein
VPVVPMAWHTGDGIRASASGGAQAALAVSAACAPAQLPQQHAGLMAAMHVNRRRQQQEGDAAGGGSQAGGVGR